MDEYQHLLFFSFTCSQRAKLEDDVYNFGLILFESLVGPIASEKGEKYFLDEKVKLLKTPALFFLWRSNNSNVRLTNSQTNITLYL